MDTCCLTEAACQQLVGDMLALADRQLTRMLPDATFPERCQAMATILRVLADLFVEQGEQSDAHV